MAAQPQAFSENQTLVIRRATPADAEVCGSNTDETTEKSAGVNRSQKLLDHGLFGS